MTEQQRLQNLLYDLLLPLVPQHCTIVWAKQSAPRPPKPYVTLDFLNVGRRIGQDELREVAGGWERQGLREFTLSVNAWGTGAGDILTELQQGLALEATVEDFAQAGITAVSESEIRDLDAKVDARWEPRAQIDMVMHRVVAAVEDLDYFNRAEINGATVGPTEEL